MKRMTRFIQRRPSGAMIVAVVALVAAIGGTAVAGGGFVSTKKFKKFRRNANVSIAQTVKGPINYATRTIIIPPSSGGGATTGVAVPCPLGTSPTGGGIKLSNNNVVSVNSSYPTTGGWAGTVFNNGSLNHTATITAICALSTTSGSPPAN